MRRHALTVRFVLCGVLASTGFLKAHGAEPEKVPAVSPATPTIPAAILEHLLERRYVEAADALAKLGNETKDASDRAYLVWIRSGALRSAGRLDDASKLLVAAVEAAPSGPWAAKIRASLAALHLAQGRPAEAEALARREVIAFLAPERKDRLAGIYRDFARSLLVPNDPFGHPDAEAAHALLLQARSLAKGDKLRASLLAEAAQASRKAKNWNRAIKEYQDYLKDHPKGEDRDAVRFALAEAESNAGKRVEARVGWSDLARDLAARTDPPSRALRTQALYHAARTYGAAPVPVNPGASRGGFQSVAPTRGASEPVPETLPEMPPAADAASLSLQIAALRRVIEAEPGHPLAVKAAFEIGRVSKALGKSQQALDAFREFVDGKSIKPDSEAAKRLQEELTAKAMLEIADVLKSQRKFDEAIETLNVFLNKNANGPGSVLGRLGILDARLAKADALFAAGKFDDARTVWLNFVAENPLDSRVPDALIHVGEALRESGKLDAAIEMYESVIARFSDGRARFELGKLYEEKKGMPERAIEQYKLVGSNEARLRIAVMETPALNVITPRTFRKGEPAQLKIATRNLERLRFTAYKLDPESFFRKKQAMRGVEDLDIGLVAPDAEWTEAVPGFSRYKPVETMYSLKGLKDSEAGFWAVKVTDEKFLQATSMVLRGNLEAVVTASRDQVLVFAQDMSTGRGRKGARMLVSDGKETIQEFSTGEDGVVIGNWPTSLAPRANLAYLVLDGDEAAGSGLGLSDKVTQGISPRAYLYSERPVYRPGQQVSLRGVVREVSDGRYSVVPGSVYSLTVTDSQGRRILSRDLALSEFGTIRTTFSLVEAAPVGSYTIRLSQPHKNAYTGTFEVQAYALEKADLRIDLARSVVFRGETVQADLFAKHQYGSPLVGRPIEVNLPDGRRLGGNTDAAGKFHIEFPTEGFAEEQPLEIIANLPQDGVSAKASVRLAVQAFRIDLTTARNVFLDGESFPLRALTLDALGTPEGHALTVSILKRIVTNGAVAEREVSASKLNTDPKTGRGETTLKVDDPDGGRYVLRASGTDRFGNVVVQDRVVTISGQKDATKLRILADRQTFMVGEPASVKLINRSGPGLALVTWQADRILSYRLVELQAGDNAMAWDVIGDQFPNFTLAAVRLDGERLDEARLDVRVERDLKVVMKPLRAVVGPGEEVVIDVTATDQLGKPVAAEFSLAMVDRTLLRLYNDKLPPIGPYFYDQTRTGAFSTTATNAFRYVPVSRKVGGVVASSGPRPSAVRSASTLANAPQTAFPGVRFPEGSTPDRPRTQRYVHGENLRGGADDPASKAIIAKLDKAVSMSFANETPLEDVIKYIKQATSDAEMPEGIPIYIDPVGLQEAEKTMTSPITIDLEGVPLKTTLRLLLSQLGLEYRIGEGLLRITSESSERDGEDLPDATDFEGGMAGMGGMGGMGGGMGGMGGGVRGRGMMGGLGGDGRGVPSGKTEPLTKETLEGVSTGRFEAAEPGAPLEQKPADQPGSEPARGAARTHSPARQQFVETAYWNPAVVTDKDGKARVTFKAPTALSEYTLTARGVTGADTLAGQTTAELAVRKDLFVDFRTPPVLVQGDKPRFSTRVHHSGVRGKVEVKLSLYAGGRDRVDTKTLEVMNDGVDDVAFEPFEIPDGDVVRLVLAAKAGDVVDEVVSEIRIKPWGVQELATASGTSSDDVSAFLTLPEGRSYEHPEMIVTISPRADRLLFELAVGREAFAEDLGRTSIFGSSQDDTTADRASDLLATSSALKALRSVKSGAERIERLSQRVATLSGALVASQNEDGGWAWVGGGRDGAPSDRRVSARVVWAIAEADFLGTISDPSALDKATAYLLKELGRTEANDFEARAAILLALAHRGKAAFEPLNALNRARNDLSDVALSYLALTFAKMERPAMAEEVVGILVTRAISEPSGPNKPPFQFWSNGKRPGPGGNVEPTALAALAFSQAKPKAEVLERAVAWLDARRCGTSWNPRTATGPAVAALAAYHARATLVDDRYRLTVNVNDVEVFKTEVNGPSEGRGIAVPRDAIKVNGKNQVRFDIEGRGTFSYSVTLSGVTRDMKRMDVARDPPIAFPRRLYLAAEPEVDGRTLTGGFASVTDERGFINVVTQVPLGGRALIVLDPTEIESDRGYLILEEYLPAGASVVEGTVKSNAVFHRQGDGVLTFYFTPDRSPEKISYEIYGAHTGQYRALPSRVRSVDYPGRYDYGNPGDLRILSPGEKSTDPYNPTPDELLTRGKVLFDAGRLKEAASPLEAMSSNFKLRDDVRKDVTRMLLYVHLATYEPRKIVADFETIREKSPELVIPFETLLTIGRAYADIGEHERAYLGWRALAEASYLEDSLVGEAFRQRGKPLEAAAYLLKLWREYPDEASIESDFFGLSQLLAGLAAKSETDAVLREELDAAGVTRSDLLAQAIRLVQAFLAQSPGSPLVDEAGFAWIGDELERKNYRTVVDLSARFARLHAKSPLRDRFHYSEALGWFQLGEYAKALPLARTLAERGEESAPNREQAVFLMGQIHEASKRPAESLEYYRRVSEKFTDAAEAVNALTRKVLTLSEVSVLRPAGAPRAENPAKPVTLTYRNVADVEVKVYSVDLMRFNLSRKGLDAVATIDLAGVKPKFQTSLRLGEGADFEEKTRTIDLPFQEDGAFLIIARAGGLFTSGIVLVTPLELDVTEQPDGGLLRVAARDFGTGSRVPGVELKVIGSENGEFVGGQTDARGVFLAEGLKGHATVVARQGGNRYALYRGIAGLGMANKDRDESRTNSKKFKTSTLEDEFRGENQEFQRRQIDRFQQRQGGMGGMMGGGFR